MSARHFRAQLEARTADKHGVVGDKRNAPANCRGGDPKIGVVMPLMQGMADPAAFIAKLRHTLDGVSVHGQHGHVGCHRAELSDPPRSPAGLQRSVAGLGNRLGCDGDEVSSEMRRILRSEA